jgi:ABC-type lipoprotein export system ATPase subunit
MFIIEVKKREEAVRQPERRRVYALDGVDFSLDEGKDMLIPRSLGIGKSTLLNMIAGSTSGTRVRSP